MRLWKGKGEAYKKHIEEYGSVWGQVERYSSTIQTLLRALFKCFFLSLLPLGFSEGKKKKICRTLLCESFWQRQHDHHEQTTKEELQPSPIAKKGRD